MENKKVNNVLCFLALKIVNLILSDVLATFTFLGVVDPMCRKIGKNCGKIEKIGNFENIVVTFIYA